MELTRFPDGLGIRCEGKSRIKVTPGYYHRILEGKDGVAINQGVETGGGVGSQKEAQAFCLGCVIRRISLQTSLDILGKSLNGQLGKESGF